MHLSWAGSEESYFWYKISFWNLFQVFRLFRFFAKHKSAGPSLWPVSLWLLFGESDECSFSFKASSSFFASQKSMNNFSLYLIYWHFLVFVLYIKYIFRYGYTYFFHFYIDFFLTSSPKISISSKRWTEVYTKLYDMNFQMLLSNVAKLPKAESHWSLRSLKISSIFSIGTKILWINNFDI